MGASRQSARGRQSGIPGALALDRWGGLTAKQQKQRHRRSGPCIEECMHPWLHGSADPRLRACRETRARPKAQSLRPWIGRTSFS
eukprot:UN3896